MNTFPIQILDLSDSRFPEKLRTIHKPPLKLYARGNLDLLKTNSIAMVGTRIYTDYGKFYAHQFTEGLVSYGFTIVSGLAYGIDGLVHSKTLKEGGKTIAVLGTAIDNIHPKRHTTLAQKILESHGLLLSEYAPGASTYPSNFPHRNRIISGLSLATVVIEAPHKSGSLITARHAFEQNREVFTLPGDLSRQTMQGNHRLIVKDMARLVRTPEDIVAYLNSNPKLTIEANFKRRKHTSPTMQRQFKTKAQQWVWMQCQKKPQRFESLLELTQLSVAELSVALSYLELKGVLTEVSGRYMIRAGPKN